MRTKSKSIHLQYERVLDLQTEAIMSLSEEELDEEIRESGLEPQELEEETRRVVAEALGRHNEQALARSRQTYQKEATLLKRVRLSLPTTMKDKLELLKACLAHHQYLKPAVLTGQHRKLSDMAPSDVDSLFRQLHVLGLLKFKKV
ncbi:MAG: hypothetical protein H8K06_08285 [Nitrospira sp.]|nr:hypothetical protein [Nitrospira sp.]